MDVLEVLAVLTFGLAYFKAGYSIGKDNNRPKRQ